MAALSSPVDQSLATLVCFSHLRWNFVFQRPQHLLSRAAERFRVLFVEEPVVRDAAVPHLEHCKSRENVEIIVPIIPPGMSADEIATREAALLRELFRSLGQPPEIAWYYTPMALKFSRDMQFPVTIYDCMDELSQFRGAPPELVRLESELLARADIVFTGGFSLYESKAGRHANVHAFPSSVDARHFHPARDTGRELPGDIASIARPRIGYFGVIDERLDIPLIENVARARPDWQIVMIGPTVKIDPDALPRQDNIHWLGMKAYDELPGYLAGLDAGWMPFASNEATEFISPTKTPEFLAAGVPVVSTPVKDVVRSWGRDGWVQIAAGVNDTVAAIGRTLAMDDRRDWLAQVDRKLASESWDATWGRMQGLIGIALAGATRRPALRAAAE